MYFCECMTLFPSKCIHTYIHICMYRSLWGCHETTRGHPNVSARCIIIIIIIALLYYAAPVPSPALTVRRDLFERGERTIVGCRWWFSGLGIIYGPNPDRNERARAAENDCATWAFRRTWWRLNGARLILHNLTQPNRPPMMTATSVSSAPATATEEIRATLVLCILFTLHGLP